MKEKRNCYVKTLLREEMIYQDDPYMVRLIQQINRQRPEEKSPFLFGFLF